MLDVISPKTIKNPDELFEVELTLYNAKTLPRLIPSLQPPPVRPAERGFYGTDFSSDKYIFGSIRYKRREDVRPTTIVILRIDSPNNHNLNLDEVTIKGVSEVKMYFLLHRFAVSMNTTDEDAILTYKIIKAVGTKRADMGTHP